MALKYLFQLLFLLLFIGFAKFEMEPATPSSSSILGSPINPSVSNEKQFVLKAAMNFPAEIKTSGQVSTDSDRSLAHGSSESTYDQCSSRKRHLSL